MTFSNDKSPLRHVPELDTLRAFSITAVAASHSMPDVFIDDGVGVDVFFVLSGYLITRILLTEFADTGRINLVNFYIRRFLRLAPALWLLLLVYALNGVRIGGAGMRQHFLAVAATGAYVMNWARIYDWTPALRLAHTWSLAVEEQFYLLIAPLLIVLLAKLRLKSVRQVFLGLALFAADWRTLLFCWPGTSGLRLYAGLDTRADTLLVGCMIALLPLDALAAYGRRLWLPALGILIGEIFNSRVEPKYPFAVLVYYTAGYSLIALCAGCVLVAIVDASERGPIPVLSWKPLVYMGRISYGIYLWHYPVLQVLKLHSSNEVLNFVGCLAVTIFIASLSWHLVEQPILRFKRRFESRMEDGKTGQRLAEFFEYY